MDGHQYTFEQTTTTTTTTATATTTTTTKQHTYTFKDSYYGTDDQTTYTSF